MRVLNQIANHAASASKRCLVRIGIMVQENYENDQCEKSIRRLHSEISYIPELVKCMNFMDELRGDMLIL